MSSNNRYVKPPSGYLSRFDPSKPCIGIVKVTTDPELMGRIKVWIKGSTSPETDPNGWIWVNYCSPFAGATPRSQLGNAHESYDATQKSYGFWGTVPDIDNEVIVMFINGDLRQGFWIGSTYQKNMNHMVPGIASGNAYQTTELQSSTGATNTNVPVSEYNKLSNNSSRRPYYKPLTEGLAKQGLLSDRLRGAGSSSARRESPSQVFGFLTPNGNQFIMDDGSNSELIRLRTKSGAQILISETLGDIYVITKDGNNWFQLSNDGHVDLYAAKDISLRSESNVNIHADGNINFEAGNAVNIKASGSGIKLETTGDTHLISKNMFMTLTEKLDISALSQSTYASSFISITSDGNINIMGQSITNNMMPGNIPVKAVEIETNQTMDKALNTAPAGQQSGQVIPDSNIKTITSRLPTHEPFAGHTFPLPGTRNQVKEDEAATTTISRGSTTEKAVSPLPVIGTPKKGMSQGVYQPKGYDKNNEPVYEFTGGTGELRPANTYRTGRNGIELIKKWEGFESSVYLDVAGLPTIGYGHLIKAGESFPNGISQEEAEAILRSDLSVAENAVRKYTKVDLTQNQFDALVSFTFNCGTGAYQKSTLLRQLNEGNYQEVPNQLMRWNRAGGQVVQGLINRRKEEAHLFATAFTGTATST